MRIPRALLRALRRGALLLALTASAYVALLFDPGPLFRYAYAGTSVVLHSDAPLPPEAAGVIAATETNLRRSPLFDPAATYDVYLCQRRWRWSLLSSGDTRAAALTLLAPVGRAILTRSADVARNRMQQASGLEAPGERTLSYYLAHEATHAMTADRLGVRRYRALPAWVREGYADYVGRGRAFDYDDARAALVGGPRRPVPQTGFYLRDTLLVAHMLEREGWTVDALFAHPPDAAVVEERVRRAPGP